MFPFVRGQHRECHRSKCVSQGTQATDDNSGSYYERTVWFLTRITRLPLLSRIKDGHSTRKSSLCRKREAHAASPSIVQQCTTIPSTTTSKSKKSGEHRGHTGSGGSERGWCPRQFLNISFVGSIPFYAPNAPLLVHWLIGQLNKALPARAESSNKHKAKDDDTSMVSATSHSAIDRTRDQLGSLNDSIGVDPLLHPGRCSHNTSPILSTFRR